MSWDVAGNADCHACGIIRTSSTPYRQLWYNRRARISRDIWLSPVELIKIIRFNGFIRLILKNINFSTFDAEKKSNDSICNRNKSEKTTISCPKILLFITPYPCCFHMQPDYILTIRRYCDILENHHVLFELCRVFVR